MSCNDVEFVVMSLQEAGLSANDLDLNKPADQDDPKAVFLEVMNSATLTDVIIYRGMCPTGGYDIEVNDVSMVGEDRKIIITVSLIDPSPDDVVMMMMTRPARVVRFFGKLNACQIEVKDGNDISKDRVEIS